MAGAAEGVTGAAEGVAGAAEGVEGVAGAAEGVEQEEEDEFGGCELRIVESQTDGRMRPSQCVKSLCCVGLMLSKHRWLRSTYCRTHTSTRV